MALEKQKISVTYLIFLLLLACGNGEKTKPVEPTPSPIELLQDKYDLYLTLQTDSFRDDCDGLLYRSLATVAGNTHINISEHYKQPLWYRSPDNDCSHTTTISRDMMIGLFWHFWRFKDVLQAETMLNYAWDHGGKMGNGDPRVMMSPSLYNTLYYIVKRLGGSGKNSTLPVESGWDKDLRGYQAHIQHLHILLRAEIEGYVEQKERLVIETAYNREPMNALFAYAYAKYISSNFEPVIAILLDINHFPNDRLPTNENHCEPWLWQREFSVLKDWMPCDTIEEHTGADFLFIAKLVLESQK